MSLMDSLGLDDVEHDPNAIPDGRYQGVVAKDEYVYVQGKDEVAHVFTYRVTEEGAAKGGSIAHWFTLGKNPQRDEFGNIVSLDFTMDETKKKWYKKAFVDLGVKPEDVSKQKPGDQAGKLINFGVKTNVTDKGKFRNVSFVELRQSTAEATPAQAAAQSSIVGEL